MIKLIKIIEQCQLNNQTFNVVIVSKPMKTDWVCINVVVRIINTINKPVMADSSQYALRYSHYSLNIGGIPREFELSESLMQLSTSSIDKHDVRREHEVLTVYSYAFFFVCNDRIFIIAFVNPDNSYIRSDGCGDDSGEERERGPGEGTAGRA